GFADCLRDAVAAAPRVLSTGADPADWFRIVERVSRKRKAADLDYAQVDEVDVVTEVRVPRHAIPIAVHVHHGAAERPEDLEDLGGTMRADVARNGDDIVA